MHCWGGETREAICLCEWDKDVASEVLTEVFSFAFLGFFFFHQLNVGMS